MSTAPAQSWTKDPKRVFLSYAHGDESRVREVHAALLAAGLHPWMDKVDLQPGSEWRDEIDRAIRSSGAFLSLISAASIERGGILRGEMKLALELRSERLDDGGRLIPVRLESCDLPPELARIQALDWFESDGRARLIQTLTSGIPPEPSRRFPIRFIAAAGIAVLLCAAVFLPVRNKPGGEGSAPGPPLTLGVTLWQLAAATPVADRPCAELRFEPHALSQPIHVTDRIRLDVRPSRAGYLYVLTTELDSGGRRGATLLLFPVSSFNNQAASGGSLLVPPSGGDRCDTFHITHLGEAEEISLLFSPEPIPELSPRVTPYALPDATVNGLERTTQASSSTEPGALQASAATLPDSESRDLGYTDAGPGTEFTFGTASAKNRRYSARFILKTGP